MPSPFSPRGLCLSRDTILAMLCVLKHLVAGNGDFVYLMLAGRDRRGELRDTKVLLASTKREGEAVERGNILNYTNYSYDFDISYRT